MALIKCPECEREISDKAEACPHCGCPTAKNIKQEQLSIADKFKEIASKAKEEIISCAKSITSAITADNRKKKTVVLFSAITVVLLIGLIIALSVSNCGGMDAQEKQCLIDLQTGLQNRWDSTDADYMSYEEYQNNISAGIDAELAMMVKYEDVTFKDDEFDAIISDYINALESQKEGVSFLFTQLVEDDVWYLQVSEDYLYYTKNDNQTGLATGFFRSHKDGSNEEILLDKEVYYSYVVADNLFYQDDNDNETIHKYNLVTKTDERITTEKSYGFVIDGQFGYYIKNDRSAADGDYVGSLIKIDLQTKQETLLYDGVSTFGMVVGETSIYFINTNDQNRIYRIGKDGEEVKLVTQDTNCTNLAIFGNRIMYLDCDDSGKLVDAIYICQEDGSNKINISRSE